MVLRPLSIIALCLFMVGCDTIITDDRVVYEDKTPAKGLKMILKGDHYTGITYTDEDGIFKFIVPPDIEVSLCAYPQWGEACYDGYLFTPTQDGELIKVEK